MNQRILIKNATIVNEGIIYRVLIADGVIRQIGIIDLDPTYKVIDGSGKHLLPGIIDGQVHLETLATHKGDLYTESKAVAGGVTSFIDMPNTVPNILTVESQKKSMLLLQKSPS
jgi:dihydroorotase